MVAHMARARFTVLQTEQCVDCAPNHTGAEAKMTAALAQIRAVNPQAAVLFYFPVSLRQLTIDLFSQLEIMPPAVRINTHTLQTVASYYTASQFARLESLAQPTNQPTNKATTHSQAAIPLLESWHT
jgi:hypothetical protein